MDVSVHKLSSIAQTAGEGKKVSQTNANAGADFSVILQQQLAQERQVVFSKHAIERTEQRGIEVTPNLLERLTDSVERAEAKGITNFLALDNSLAFIVNVPNNRVITAMSEEEMKENIFTNIDGAVIL